MDNLERFNKPGLRDAYNVLKYIETKKGGSKMDKPKKPIRPEDKDEEEPTEEELEEIEEEDDEETFDEDP